MNFGHSVLNGASLLTLVNGQVKSTGLQVRKTRKTRKKKKNEKGIK